VLEARSLVRGKVAERRDVSESGLHVFFGAYPNTMKLFKDSDIDERPQRKNLAMILPNLERGKRNLLNLISLIGLRH